MIFRKAFLIIHQYNFLISLFLKIEFILESALLVFERITIPDVGLSILLTNPRNTFPFLEYLIFRYSLTKSIKLLSPVLSPWTNNPAGLFIIIRWLSSKMILWSSRCNLILFFLIRKVPAFYVFWVFFNSIAN